MPACVLQLFCSYRSQLFNRLTDGNKLKTYCTLFFLTVHVFSRRFTVYKPARAERHKTECGEEDGESSDEEVYFHQ
jgi:hypothetical protein